MERFSHPLIRLLISDFTPADSQASSFVMAYGNFLSGDGGIPAGGSRAMAFRMAKKARSLGAKIVTGKAVQKILAQTRRRAKPMACCWPMGQKFSAIMWCPPAICQ